MDDRISQIVTLRRLTKAMKEYGQDSQEVLNILQQQRNTLQRMSMSMMDRPFIIHPNQLDTTQPRDVGYGTPEWRIAWEKRPYKKRLHPRPRDNALSCQRNLQVDVLGKEILFNTHTNTFGLLCEYSRREGRRCCFVRCNGMRCMKYSATGVPVCQYHYRLVESVPRMNDRFLNSIKSEPLRKAYENHLKDPNRKSIESELALMRTMLDAMLHRIEIGTDLNRLPVEMLAAIMTMCEKITGTVERMAAIEAKLGMRLSLDQVTNIMYAVVDLVFKTCPNLEQAQLTAIADGIEKLPIMKTASPDSINSTAGYGTSITEGEGQKMSNACAKYKEDGTVDPKGFTEAEVIEHKKMIDDKFKPFQEAHAERKEMMDKLLKTSNDWGVKTTDTEGTVEKVEGDSDAT